MYRVQLSNFEGPLDLLLFFIKRDELDIYDIPISYITEQFLEYLNMLEELDLDIASEFILMASMLMSIKAKMMLPREENEDEELDETDPRYELVQRLLEYKRYKEMSEKMADMDEDARKVYKRGFPQADEVDRQPSGEALQDVTMFHLIAAFKKVLQDIERKAAMHHVEKVDTTVEEQTEFVINRLMERGKSSFMDICRELKNKIYVVVTFLAVLEMIKEQQIILYLDEDPTQFYIELNPVDEFIDA